MAQLYDYVLKSRGLTRELFANEFPFPFLCAKASDGAERRQWSFKTETVSSLGFNVMEKLEEQGLSLAPEIAQYEVFPVKKLPGNPWPDRMSVGRARNSDIVLPDNSVSKLHAHFVYDDDGDLTLVDAGSRNGTFVGKTKLTAGAPEKVSSGEQITFGAIVLRYLSAEDLFELIERYVRPKSATGG